MARRSRKKENDEIVKENIVESEPININIELLSPKPEEEPKIIITAKEDDVKGMNEDFGIDMKEEMKEVISEEFDVSEEKIEAIVKEKKPTQGLSRAQMRIFERTGIIKTSLKV